VRAFLQAKGRVLNCAQKEKVRPEHNACEIKRSGRENANGVRSTNQDKHRRGGETQVKGENFSISGGEKEKKKPTHSSTYRSARKTEKWTFSLAATNTVRVGPFKRSIQTEPNSLPKDFCKKSEKGVKQGENGERGGDSLQPGWQKKRKTFTAESRARREKVQGKSQTTLMKTDGDPSFARDT